MDKYVFRQVPPGYMDCSTFFDTDCFTEAAGGFSYTLFILYYDHGRLYGLNSKDYENVVSNADGIVDGFEEVKDGITNWRGEKESYKDVMKYYGIEYNPTRCHALKEWAENADTAKIDTIAEYLSITTGKKWETTCARGYCQGDYVDILYCTEHYTEKDAVAYGEIYLGACTEFSLKEPCEELEVYGFFVADSQAWRDEDVKKLLCEQEGLKPEETEVLFIENQHTRVEYEYRTV